MRTLLSGLGIASVAAGVGIVMFWPAWQDDDTVASAAGPRCYEAGHFDDSHGGVQLTGGDAETLELDVQDRAGEPAPLVDGSTPLRLVNMWATWCAPCIREMADLNALADAMPEDLEVVAVSFDRNPAAAQRFLDDCGYDALTDRYAPPAALHAVAQGLPTTVLLGSGGEVLAKVEGAAAWASEPMINQIRQFVEVNGPGG